ncbi:hypothetical protein K458DRAFT_394907 [Lentithecium fluviatile CBS 122367]|uniref:Uncharacterized protein n=1 Tax=Lentithecium fluviatile CBS 122367 TaxID=1168545 RepID=A0A6G1IK86_9PLEO|nr:hypothetical protein K458DRAFT_394907 [Lentithecium fluviatile CBS 122367]
MSGIKENASSLSWVLKVTLLHLSIIEAFSQIALESRNSRIQKLPSLAIRDVAHGSTECAAYLGDVASRIRNYAKEAVDNVEYHFRAVFSDFCSGNTSFILPNRILEAFEYKPSNDGDFVISSDHEGEDQEINFGDLRRKVEALHLKGVMTYPKLSRLKRMKWRRWKKKNARIMRNTGDDDAESEWEGFRPSSPENAVEDQANGLRHLHADGKKHLVPADYKTCPALGCRKKRLPSSKLLPYSLPYKNRQKVAPKRRSSKQKEKNQQSKNSEAKTSEAGSTTAAARAQGQKRKSGKEAEPANKKAETTKPTDEVKTYPAHKGLYATTYRLFPRSEYRKA